MNHKLSYRVLRIGQFGCFIPLLLAYLLSQDPKLMGAAVALCALSAAMLFGALIQALFFYRCPHCDRAFSFRSSRPEYCPGCGKQIQW